MSEIRVIAQNTFKEIIRDRILYGLVVFALVVMGMSLALGQLSFAEQTRISINFGFAAMHLSVVVLSIFVGSSLVSREIEKRTVLTLLSRPMTRSTFLMGKFAGLTSVIALILLGLSVVLATVLWGYGMSWNRDCVTALLGIFMESLVLLGMTMFFGVFLRPMLTVIFSLSFFLIGHWLDSMNFFAQNGKSVLFATFNKICQFLLPNLERFNWRAFATSDQTVPYDIVAEAGFYALAWIVFLMSVTCLIFRRKDFV